jgi:hypothetical protein
LFHTIASGLKFNVTIAGYFYFAATLWATPELVGDLGEDRFLGKWPHYPGITPITRLTFQIIHFHSRHDHCLPPFLKTILNTN